MMWLSKNIKVLGSFFHQKWEVFVCSMWWGYSVFGFTGNQFCYNSKHEWHSHHTHRCTYFLLKQTENRGHKFYRAQKNLEKPEKPGKTDFFEKSQGNSGKLRKFRFFEENQGKLREIFLWRTFPSKLFEFHYCLTLEILDIFRKSYYQL